MNENNIPDRIKEAARFLRPQFQKGMRQLAERLEYAADFLETEA